ncbi:uncharacterized protein [Palaemon carinicauda]|uniref:uncharacterized protein isoform X2 n=1 Tax=Palaemon carinicauda TaxID=392227 RepID=UPI0035B57F1D
MEVGAKVSSLDTVNATNKKIQIKNAKKDKFECGAKSKRKAKSKLYQENEYLLVPHEERSGNMNITEHIVNKESKNLSKGLVNQRQLAHNEIVPKYASEVSPLSPDTESHYLGNKNFKFLHKSGKSTEIMNVYKRFLASVGLNEYTLRNISGVYNLRNLQLEKQSPEINILESINLKGQLKENTDLMLERRESDLPSQNMNAASPKNSGSAKFSQHFEDMCSKEDGYGAEGLSLGRIHVGSGGLEKAGLTCGYGPAISLMKFFHQNYWIEQAYLKQAIKRALSTMKSSQLMQQIIP